MDYLTKRIEDSQDVEFLHEIGSRMAAADSLDSILQHILDFISDLVRCDSCLVYVLQGDQLVLSASKNPHPDLVHRLGIAVGQGITGWVAEHRETVAIAAHASTDPRFRMFHDLPEDLYEAFLSVPILALLRVAYRRIRLSRISSRAAVVMSA